MWALSHDKEGLATESSGGFALPSGARLSPDASWISRNRLRLIDTKTQSVTIYRPGQEPETRTRILQLAGEGRVEGLMLELERRVCDLKVTD